MTPADIAEWRRLAEAVESPSPWTSGPQEDSGAPAVYNADDYYVCLFEHGVFAPEAAYIAHSSPDRVLAVLGEVERQAMSQGVRAAFEADRATFHANLARTGDPTVSDERYEVRHQDIERYLRTLASLIDTEAPEGWGWGLFLVKHGDNPKALAGPSTDGAGAVFWISNSERAGMVDCVKGWIEDQEKRRKGMTNG